MYVLMRLRLILTESLPGNGDGGVLLSRYTKEAWEFVYPVPGVQPTPATNAELVKKQLHQLLLIMFLQKTEGNMSHVDVTRALLDHKAGEYLSPEVRHNIPTSFYAMLNALEQLGEELPKEVQYDYCVKCYSVFRKEKKDWSECSCGHPRWRSDTKGDKVAYGYYKYRCCVSCSICMYAFIFTSFLMQASPILAGKSLCQCQVWRASEVPQHTGC
jgi:hypothetical protein